MRLQTLAPVVAFALVAACGGSGGDPVNQATAEGPSTPNGGVRAPSPPPAPQTASNGPQYVALAGAGDLFEIECAAIARQKSQRPDVRQFAAMIIADHRRSTAELARAASQARPPLPASPRLGAEQQADLQALRNASGRTFDAIYLRQQVNAHEQALNLVTSYASSGESEPLRRHAASVAEPIRRHLARARELEVPAPR